jgi:hypothetical protein
MEYNINPIGYYNGFISASRNIFLTSTVGLALFTYSSSFKIASSIDIVRLGSMGILLFSILYGINTTYGMNKYINMLKRDNKELQEDIQINLWKNYTYLNIYYIVLLVVILLTALRRFMNRKF